MRLMVTFEARFVRAPDGNVYARGPVTYDFLSRYLRVFDEVVVLSRVEDVAAPDLTQLRQASGPNVRFYGVPYYVGPWQYMRRCFQVKAAIKEAVDEADAFILRVPGAMGNILCRELRRRSIEYGVEVVADPWDVWAKGSVKFFLRPILRRRSRSRLSRICRKAGACSYVTRESLQRRYPPGGWSTYYSDVELPDASIVDTSALGKRLDSIESKRKSGTTFRICFVGSMEQLYKAPDTVVGAMAKCIDRGLNVKLTMVGDGQYVSELESLCVRLGIKEKVDFIGKVNPGAEVFEQMDQADVFVLPSRQEGLPRTMVEAMARGMPCIGSNVGGIPELLAAEDVVPPADSEALADKIDEVLSRDGRLEEMSSRNLRTAQEYCRSKLVGKWVEFYNKVAEISQGSQIGEIE